MSREVENVRANSHVCHFFPLALFTTKLAKIVFYPNYEAGQLNRPNIRGVCVR